MDSTQAESAVRRYYLAEQSGDIRLELILLDTGHGLSCCLTGGARPHVGGVSLATPRASLTGEGRSADVAAVPVSGHLDNEVASPMAKQLCVAVNSPVSVTAGIHMDNADRATICRIRQACLRLTERAVQLLCEGRDSTCRS